MSILVKGLIMPSCCDGCTFSDWSNLHQTACCKLHDYDPCFSDHSREYTDKRADFCPLVEIPVHGRLIDADALKETLDYYICEANWGDEVNKGLRWVKDEFINSENTVIEAEGSENHDD